ncbi:MAG: hypothetical protein ACLFNX_11980 [Spirochaetaceae bacterium]
MRRRQRGSDALFHSLSEFAYIMLFLSLAAALALFAQNDALEARAAEYAAENEELTEEVAFLTEILEEKRHGVVPCWRRPEEAVPKVAATVVIHDETSFTVTHTASGDSVGVAADAAAESAAAAPDSESSRTGGRERLDASVRSLLAEDLRYAGEKTCYLRVAIENETNDYALYEEVAEVVTGAGMVVARD